MKDGDRKIDGKRKNIEVTEYRDVENDQKKWLGEIKAKKDRKTVRYWKLIESQENRWRRLRSEDKRK